MALGLFRQEKLAPDTGGASFKEGNVKVVKAAVFRNHHPEVRAGQKDRGTIAAIVLEVHRLDEDLDPILNQDEEPVKEEIVLGLGNGSLKDIHPGRVESLEALSEDEPEIEDLGTEDGEEGNTLYLVNKNWQLHPKTAAGIFLASLQKGREKEKEKGQFHFKGCQLPPEKVDALFYGPSWKGYVFHIKNWVDPDNTFTDEVTKKERSISYKIVEKILKSPGKGKEEGKEEKAAPATEAEAGGKKKKKAAEAETEAEPKKEVKAETNGNKQVEGVVATILTNLSNANDGETLTMKQFRTQCKEQLDKMGGKVPEELHVDVISMYKDIDWLLKHGEKYDMTVSEDRASVTFAT